MRGTLFSADFVKDANDNLRLLELNTDTGIISTELYNFDFTEFINVLQVNNITQLDIVYKPYIHNKIVNHISDVLTANALFVTTINLHSEDIGTIYPTTIPDSNNNFVLRLAYDESALFDSTYCKGTVELLNLFTSNDESSKVVSYFYSTSTESNNSLELAINPPNIPDVAVKDIIEQFNPIDFYKIGSAVDGESDEARWESFLSLINTENKIIQQYHYGPSGLDENGHITSIRSFHIVYGNNLDVITLHNYKISSIFNLPAELTPETVLNQYVNKLSDNHYYEYTTNFVKSDCAGILSTHEILMKDMTYRPISDVNVGNSIKSYSIAGSPQLENNFDIMNWEMQGRFFPSGSYMTESVVVYKDEKQLKYGGLIEIIVDSESKFIGPNKQFLSYDSSTDSSKYKYFFSLKPGIDYFFDIDGNLVDIDEVNFYVTTDTELKMIELDVEDTDTYIIGGSTSFNGVISHNAPCFVSGTKITMSDISYKNVEDVQIGDMVLSYNFSTSKVENQKVKGIGSKTVDKIVRYLFNDNSILESTLDHPLYSEQNGWVSADSNYTMNVYGLKTKKVEVGMKIFKQDGTNPNITSIEIISESTVVYNVKTVENNHNFFANNLLVHNRCFTYNTPVHMWDGSIKYIGDIEIGDFVLSYKDGINVKGTVTEKLIHPTNAIAQVVKYKEMISEILHPYFEDGVWKPLCESDRVKLDIQYIDNFYALVIDGNLLFESEHNFIVEDFIVSALGDHELLNKTFKRQVIFQ